MGPKRQKLKYVLQRYMPLLFVVAMAVLMLMPLRPEEKTRLLTAFRDFLHFPASFVLFWICLNLKWMRWKKLSRETTCAIFVQGVHTVLEIAQPVLNRSASWADWFLGLGGVCAGYLVYKALLVGAKKGRKRMLLAAVMLLGLALLPTLRQAYDKKRAQKEFPLLASFESRLELGRWQLYGYKGELSKEGVTLGQRAARFTETLDFSYSGWFLEEVPGDWTEFDQLEFSITWTGKGSRKGDVRVDDMDESTYANQGHAGFVLVPGPNRIVIPLKRLFQTDSGRVIDGAAIRRFGISMLEKKEAAVVLVDQILLK